MAAACGALGCEPAANPDARTETQSVSPAQGNHSTDLELFGVVGGALLDNGYVIAHGSESQLVYFDDDGTVRAFAGRAGSGPGEFRHIYGMWKAAGLIYVYDGGLRRLTGWDEDGSLVSSFVVESDLSGAIVPIGVGPNRLVVRTRRVPVRRSGEVTRDTIQIASGAIPEVSDGDVAIGELLAVAPGREFYWPPDAPYGAGLNLPLGADAIAAAGAGIVVVGDAATGIMSVMRRKRREQIDLSEYLVRRPVTSETIRVALEKLIDRGSRTGPRDQVERYWNRTAAHLPFPDRRPYADRAMIESDSVVWFSSYSFPEPDAEWVRLNLNSGTASSVSLPDNSRLLAADGNRLLLLLTRDDGTESVAVFDLQPGT